MDKRRLEAFSDSVIAVLITIMVLNLAIPHGATPAVLFPLLPILLIYALSYINLGIYWSNHHHLLQATEQVDGKVLWANLHLLFWLSLVPFTTGWMGENRFAPWPVALYGVVLLFSAIAYFLLTRALLPLHDQDSVLAKALGRDIKGKVSILVYLAALPLAFLLPWLSLAIYVGVAIMWLIPDRRIEDKIIKEDQPVKEKKPVKE